MIKYLTIIILILIVVQISTFYTISNSFLIKEIGRNHESYVLEYEENDFRYFAILTKFDLSENQIQTYFSQLNGYNVSVCKSYSECDYLRKFGNFYLYWFEHKIKHPFNINLINEAEAAEEYGATWESKYIWIIYKWYLIEKVNTGIS